MGNTYTAPPTVPDTGDLIAGRIIKTESLNRMGDLSNYIHATGGTTNCISQAFDQFICVTNSTSYVDLCRWKVPIPSNQHTTIDFHIIGKITTTGTGTVKFTLVDGNSVAQGNSTISVTATSNTALTVSHSFSSATTSDHVEVVMSGKVDAATYDLELQCVAARFLPLSSPLSAGDTAQGTDKITPFGLNRLGANNALSSRAGVQFRTNINTIRSRKRVLLSWSGIENPSSAFASRGRGPKSLGIGDAQTIQNQSPLFAGGGDLTLYVYVQGYTSGTAKFSFMNQIFNITGNGWLNYTLVPLLDRITLESNTFGLLLYKISPTVYDNADSAMDSIQREAAIDDEVRITAVSVWSN
jgi:hypothetical protein